MKRHGTQVTKETFLEWKAIFDAERHAKQQHEGPSTTLVQKLTGRQLFEADLTLALQDAGDEDDSSIEIEEGLF